MLALPRRAARPAGARGGPAGFDPRADALDDHGVAEESPRARRLQGRRRATQSVPGRQLDPAGRARARGQEAEGARPEPPARDHPGAAQHSRAADAVPAGLRHHRRGHLSDRVSAGRAFRPAEPRHQRRRRRDEEDGAGGRREAGVDDAPDRLERDRHIGEEAERRASLSDLARAAVHGLPRDRLRRARPLVLRRSSDAGGAAGRCARRLELDLLGPGAAAADRGALVDGGRAGARRTRRAGGQDDGERRRRRHAARRALPLSDRGPPGRRDLSCRLHGTAEEARRLSDQRRAGALRVRAGAAAASDRSRPPGVPVGERRKRRLPRLVRAARRPRLSLRALDLAGRPDCRFKAGNDDPFATITEGISAGGPRCGGLLGTATSAVEGNTDEEADFEASCGVARDPGVAGRVLRDPRRVRAGRTVGAAPGESVVPPKGIDKNSRLDSRLDKVAAAGPTQALPTARRSGLDTANNRVRVVVETSGAGAQAAITAAGGTVESAAGGLVEALVPAAGLDALSRSSGVARVRAPMHAVALGVESQGVAATSANAWHAAGATGVGAKVAIIDLGFAGYAARQAAGELPAGLVTQDYCGGSMGAPGAARHRRRRDRPRDGARRPALPDLHRHARSTSRIAEEYAKTNWITIVNHSVGWFNTGRGDGSGGADDTGRDRRRRPRQRHPLGQLGRQRGAAALERHVLRPGRGRVPQLFRRGRNEHILPLC